MLCMHMKPLATRREVAPFNAITGPYVRYSLQDGGWLAATRRCE